jgi:hypothetical protein
MGQTHGSTGANQPRGVDAALGREEIERAQLIL